ncbi:GyrI-like domain-containing protein [Butyrivibrio sp. JL13D10]|uniref:GyrI-like domain-containing protein n=1 Tax=Butyrivibrio sp. JL13D10 TaxID=3236815 RepID=UPI0038B561EA
MGNKALVVIDIQNDITKNYRKIIDRINQAIDWAVREATVKKKQDFSKVEFFTYDEGLCVQCMHIGSYDNEPATVDAMHRFIEEQGYVLDITDKRLHHEIYLSDARKVQSEKLKTVIRHPLSADRNGV